MRCFPRISTTKRISLHLLFESTGPITLFLGPKKPFLAGAIAELAVGSGQQAAVR
jgi:hypothetical protein